MSVRHLIKVAVTLNQSGASSSTSYPNSHTDAYQSTMDSFKARGIDTSSDEAFNKTYTPEFQGVKYDGLNTTFTTGLQGALDSGGFQNVFNPNTSQIDSYEVQRQLMGMQPSEYYLHYLPDRFVARDTLESTPRFNMDFSNVNINPDGTANDANIKLRSNDYVEPSNRLQDISTGSWFGFLPWVNEEQMTPGFEGLNVSSEPYGHGEPYTLAGAAKRSLGLDAGDDLELERNRLSTDPDLGNNIQLRNVWFSENTPNSIGNYLGWTDNHPNREKLLYFLLHELGHDYFMYNSANGLPKDRMQEITALAGSYPHRQYRYYTSNPYTQAPEYSLKGEIPFHSLAESDRMLSLYKDLAHRMGWNNALDPKGNGGVLTVGDRSSFAPSAEDGTWLMHSIISRPMGKDNSLVDRNTKEPINLGENIDFQYMLQGLDNQFDALAVADPKYKEKLDQAVYASGGLNRYNPFSNPSKIIGAEAKKVLSNATTPEELEAQLQRVNSVYKPFVRDYIKLYFERLQQQQKALNKYWDVITQNGQPAQNPVRNIS